MNAGDLAEQEQAKLSRVLCGLETLGLPIAEHFSAPEWHDDVTLQDHNRHEAVHTQPLEPFFEAFLQTFNHYLFLFSESELRQSFNPPEHVSDGDNDLPIHIYLVLALGAKASSLQVEDIQNEFYIKARLRLLSGESKANLWMMRILLLICLFEIDDHVNVSYRFLSMIPLTGHFRMLG